MSLTEENSYWYSELCPCPYTQTQNYISYAQNSHLQIAKEHKPKWISPELTDTTDHKFHSVDVNEKPATSPL